ncbi:MAG: hypothetical protein CVU05_03855 [Bacteroidetes bacterium HGW-Bacteroidetes-21]|jgi:hypothetical protein|nr:MAG: hypothetical protein CVU05_03855 [Bacteroidetes bacterium HGW-Bacteroidetes-21]
MKNIIYAISLCLLFSNVSSQDFSLPYTFSGTPDFSVLIKDYDLQANDEIRVLDDKVVEYAYDNKGSLYEYLYIHVVNYVNSEEAIDRNNKIYVSLSEANQLVAYDCRVVSSSKEIKLLGKDALKEGTNDDGEKVHYFAVSGAEKGSFIEYFYLIKRTANISGNFFVFQREIPVAKSIFKIISPKNLVFITKSYNGYTELQTDTSLKDKNYLYAECSNIKRIEKEDFANEDANKMMVIFQLDYNTSSNKRKYFNYGLACQNIFENISAAPSSKAKKEIETILKKSNIAYARDEENKIFKIEDYVKKTFNFIDNPNEQLSNLDYILKFKAYNASGGIKLFYHLLETAGIENEIVLTSNRYDVRFDADFESWLFLNEYLFYFPKLQKFLMPKATAYRIGIIPYGYINNNGLFIRKVKVGDIYTGVGKVKFIPPNTADHTQHIMIINAKINSTMDSVNVNLKQTYTGYYAQSYQPYFDYIATDKIKTFEQEIINSMFKDITIKTLNIENKGGENLMINPLVIKSDFSSGNLIEKANDKILLKFGDLIGPQSELYQEHERVFPVENDFNRNYSREIHFTIPEGYFIKNPESLIIVSQPFLNEGDGSGFVSSYKLEGNELTVNISEYYRQISFPIEDYEKCRSIINAAANFNKIVLVLEKNN